MQKATAFPSHAEGLLTRKSDSAGVGPSRQQYCYTYWIRDPLLRTNCYCGLSWGMLRSDLHRGAAHIPKPVQKRVCTCHTATVTATLLHVGFGLFAQILVVNGIMQVTPANQMSRTSRGVSHNRTVMDYRNYHYNSIIAKINSSRVTVTTVDEAVRTYSSLFNVLSVLTV